MGASGHCVIRLFAYLNIIQQRDDLLVERIGQGIRLEDLLETKPFFRRHPEPVEVNRMFERMMVEKHIERLVKMGRVSCYEDWIVME